MSSSIIIFIGAIIVLLALWQFTARSSQRKDSQGQSAHTDSASFRSVGIDVGKHCCRAANNIRGERYLINQAPPLPLAACESTQCRCKYIHFADRRTDERRDFPAPPSMLGKQREEKERRSRQDRRKD